MRALAVALVLLAVPLAGCAGGTNPNLRPPCADSSPVRVEVLTDKERYIPGEVINASLLLNNTAPQARTLTWRSFELSLRAFDGKAIRTFVREEPEPANRTAPAQGRVVLQERWPVFRVNAELLDPLPPGTYYLCAVLVGVDGSTLATGARPFIAERSPQPL